MFKLKVGLIHSLLWKKTDAQLIISINDKIIDENNVIEEISSHQNLTEVIDHTCDDNGEQIINT